MSSNDDDDDHDRFFAATRAKSIFCPQRTFVDLDGNSLDPMPHTAAARLTAAMQQEWGTMLLVSGWNAAGWVIGDFRAPDLLRFLGFAPLYHTPQDIAQALNVLEHVLNNQLWDCEEYKRRKAVT